MHRPAVRSALRRRLELARARQNLPICLRSISTASSLQADEKSKPTVRQRIAAAASELSNLNRPSSSPSPGTGTDARSLGASSSSGNIINVRSLPRRSSGSFPGPSGVSTPAPRGPRITRVAVDSGDPRVGGARSARGGRGGRGRGRGGRRPWRERKKDEEREENKKDKATAQKFSAAQQAWLDTVEQGVETDYVPSLTLENLVGYGPAVATSTEGSLGQVEGVLRSMRILGGGVAYCDDLQASETTRQKIKKGESVFFDTDKDREFVKDLTVKGPSEQTKTAISRTVLEGRYTGPKFAEGGDTMGTLQSYHARDATYKPGDGRAFDAKVRSLLPAQAAKDATTKKAQV